MTKEQLIETAVKYVYREISEDVFLTAVDAYSSASNDGKPIVSGSLPSDEDIEKYFSWGYGGDAGSAIFGAKWLKKEILLGGNSR